MSKECTKCLKGIFAVCVLLHHLYQYSGLFQNHALGVIFQAMGYLSVSIFFMLSGYGLTISSKKAGYLNHFLRNKLVPFYLFYVFLILLYTVYNTILGNGFSLNRFMKSFVFGDTYVALGWYLQVTFLIYLVIWNIFKYVKDKKLQIAIFTISLIFYSCVCCWIGLEKTWYQSIFCTVLGMVLATEKNKIEQVIQVKAIFIIIESAVLFAATFIAAHLLSDNLLFKVLSTLFFAMLIFTIAYLLGDTRVICNKLTNMLGDYSLEIYVSQGFFLMLRNSVNMHIENTTIFIMIVIIGTGFISYGVKKMYNIIYQLTAFTC